MGRKPALEPIESNFIQLLYDSEVHWDITDNPNGHGTRYEVICGICNQPRMIYRTAILGSLKRKQIFTGLCNKCHKSIFPPPNNQGKIFNVKHKSISSEEYVVISLAGLPQETLDIASSMSQSGGRNSARRVLEHRLIMAVHLGRPLSAEEVVHHKNGIRTDNRLENLELLTIKSHPQGHGDIYYQLYQEALTEIERLKSIDR